MGNGQGELFELLGGSKAAQVREAVAGNERFDEVRERIKERLRRQREQMGLKPGSHSAVALAGESGPEAVSQRVSVAAAPPLPKTVPLGTGESEERGFGRQVIDDLLGKLGLFEEDDTPEGPEPILVVETVPDPDELRGLGRARRFLVRLDTVVVTGSLVAILLLLSYFLGRAGAQEGTETGSEDLENVSALSYGDPETPSSTESGETAPTEEPAVHPQTLEQQREATPEPAPDSVAAPAQESQWVLICIHSDREGAERVARYLNEQTALTSRELRAYTKPAGSLYQVRIGGFAEKDGDVQQQVRSLRPPRADLGGAYFVRGNP